MKKIRFFCLLLPVLLLCACVLPETEVQVWAYDTVCTGKIRGLRHPEAVFETAAAQGETLLREDGGKSLFAQRDGETFPVSDDWIRIWKMAGVLTEKTGGKFDLTVAPLTALWDVSHAQAPPSAEEVAEARKAVGREHFLLSGNRLTAVSAGCGIDIGSVGKGYGADLTVRKLQEAGASSGVLSFGGNVAVFGNGNETFRIAIRDPEETSEYVGILTLSTGSAVTAGAYERFFEYGGTVYHHLIDATTGYPGESDLLSVTVVCEDGAQADLLATALWLSGKEEGLRILRELDGQEGFCPSQAVFVGTDRTVTVTEGLAASFSLTSSEYCLEDSE